MSWRGVLVFAAVLLSLATPAAAVQYLGTTEFTCTDFTAAGTGAAVLDRDNTGTGAEQVRIDVRDGAGTLLYTLTFSNALGSYSGGLINATPYTTAPQFNPLTLTATSLAGNGLPELVGYTATGTCETLRSANAIPALGVTGVLALALALIAAAVLALRRAA